MIKKELENYIWEKIMNKNVEKISWHFVRKMSDSDEESDKNCQEISEEFGLKITYKGGIIEY